MKKCKRFGSLLLALVLALTLAVPAFAAEDAGYSDVDAGASYAEAVIWCREHKLMDGVGGGRFDPDGNLTRAALATVLYRMEGEPAVTGEDSFTDTDSGVWYSNAVLWASQRELMGGYGNGRFGTNDPVTRQDMATILYRYAGSPEVDSGESYDDETAISDYAAAAVDWASAAGIVSALSGNTFAPQASAARAQIAVALMNYSRNQQTAPTEPTPTPSEGGRVLIAYFSATNNTEGIANHLNAVLDADLYEITPETPYTSADLNYNTDCRANREQNDASARPAISGSVDNMEQYDVILLGYPNWWASIPMPVASFLEEYDFSGKTIVPFCSHGGGRFGQSLTAITKLAPDAVLGEGLAVSYSGGSSLPDDVAAWLEENSIPAN